MSAEVRSRPSDPPLALECRLLRRSDLPEYGAVIAAGLGPLERSVGLERSTTTLVSSLRKPIVWALYRLFRAVGRTIIIYVGVDRGRLLGTASVMFQPRAGVIVGVATAPDARGHGVATRLMEEAHRRVRAAGKTWFALDVESGNEPARRIYRRLGYTDAAEFDWFVGPVPAALPAGAVPPVELPRSSLGAAAAYVERHRTDPYRAAFPPVPALLSHLELLFRMPGSKGRTWEVRSPAGTRAVVRAFFAPMNQVGYVVPVAWDPSLVADELRAALVPALEWFRTVGAELAVVAVSGAPPGWNESIGSFGLARAVSSTLMLRPAND